MYTVFVFLCGVFCGQEYLGIPRVSFCIQTLKETFSQKHTDTDTEPEQLTGFIFNIIQKLSGK